MDAAQLTALGEVRGYLEAFACHLDRADHGHSFDIDELPEDGDLRDAVSRHLGDGVRAVTLGPTEPWRPRTEAVLRKWLFATPGSPTHDGGPRGMTSADDADRAARIEWVTDRIGAIVGSPADARAVRAEFDGFYECAWDDLVIVGPGARLFLHFGVSD